MLVVMLLPPVAGVVVERAGGKVSTCGMGWVCLPAGSAVGTKTEFDDGEFGFAHELGKEGGRWHGVAGGGVDLVLAGFPEEELLPERGCLGAVDADLEIVVLGSAAGLS